LASVTSDPVATAAFGFDLNVMMQDVKKTNSALGRKVLPRIS
jgi:hypothetical protein